MILPPAIRDSREAETLTDAGVKSMNDTALPDGQRLPGRHRIRLEISSSNYPRFDVNPNTGEPLGRHTRMVAAENTIHHAAARPSAVHLPLQRR